MTKRMSILLIVLTIISGLIGGSITCRIFTPRVAIAEETMQGKILTVEGLRVISNDGKLLMQLGKDPDNAEKGYGLFIYDSSGIARSIVSVCKSNVYSGGYIGVVGKDSDTMITDNMVNVSSKDGNTMMTDHSIDISRDDKITIMITDKIISISGKNGNATMNVDEAGGNIGVFDKNRKVGAMMNCDGTITRSGKNRN